ncbi:biopolymer transporter ExbD [Pelagivirga sediminicola]|uniref:Biopolymer transporter ExbD n=1 Tax=Pelagivirga sediminicola TaxID=2170575 RepID=A0A2T7G861_9RHOB|nr:biopolymer transporter ExbD [Pelagivirga sediminicola]PVA10577.1 biopolymer transporter ExbD [Pelagivirga sediminicola]
MSMTSLIDVIFLLLLFFMLTSTFSKFSEIELSAAGGGAGASSDPRPLFVQLGAEELTLNGERLDLSGLVSALPHEAGAPVPLLISLRGGVTSQRLTDLLVALRPARGVAPTVLGDT